MTHKRTLIRKAVHIILGTIYNFRHRYFDNFIFIHINKTGGSSIVKSLRIPFDHKTAKQKIEEIGSEHWEKKFSFTVVRNPWDKVVSHYHYRVQTNQTDLGVKNIEFRKWVLSTYGSKDPFYYNNPKMFMPQSDWITGHNGKIIVDHICRFENLNDDFSTICKKLGKKSNLPHLKASKRGHYRNYYDDDTIEIVTNWFEKDIKNFGYRF